LMGEIPPSSAGRFARTQKNSTISTYADIGAGEGRNWARSRRGFGGVCGLRGGRRGLRDWGFLGSDPETKIAGAAGQKPPRREKESFQAAAEGSQGNVTSRLGYPQTWGPPDQGAKRLPLKLKCRPPFGGGASHRFPRQFGQYSSSGKTDPNGVSRQTERRGQVGSRSEARPGAKRLTSAKRLPRRARDGGGARGRS